MPHLAPLSWTLAPILFWIILLAISSSLWWSITPNFPQCTKSTTYKAFSSWNWS